MISGKSKGQRSCCAIVTMIITGVLGILFLLIALAGGVQVLRHYYLH